LIFNLSIIASSSKGLTILSGVLGASYKKNAGLHEQLL